jgi:hypothetical protein
MDWNMREEYFSFFTCVIHFYLNIIASFIFCCVTNLPQIQCIRNAQCLRKHFSHKGPMWARPGTRDVAYFCFFRFWLEWLMRAWRTHFQNGLLTRLKSWCFMSYESSSHAVVLPHMGFSMDDLEFLTTLWLYSKSRCPKESGIYDPTLSSHSVSLNFSKQK